MQTGQVKTAFVRAARARAATPDVIRVNPNMADEMLTAVPTREALDAAHDCLDAGHAAAA